MKYILIIAILSITSFSCKAQSPILNMEDQGVTKMNTPDNAYYKDVNNELNNFVGTWLYTNGTVSLKITITKLTMYFNGDFYEDIMIGGYQYIVDGVEKINTLADANSNDPYNDASIAGNNIYDDCSYIPANDCVEGEKRLSLGISDPITEEHFGNLLLHKRTVNGQETLKAMINIGYSGRLNEGQAIPLPTIPAQMENIIFIKQ